MVRYATAAVLEKLGMPLTIKKIELPRLLPGQLLIKVYFSGVCRSQLMEVKGARGEDKWLPHLLGHEGTGVVLEVGPSCSKINVGDEVVMGWIKGDGFDAAGAKYLCGNQVINSGAVTTFSNYSVVSENRVVLKPKGLANDAGILFGCALPTGGGMVLNQMDLTANSMVVVLGLGGVGLSSLSILAAQKCKKIIAIDISDQKLEMAKSFGATHTLNPLMVNVEKAVRYLTGIGADFCLESGGTVDSIETGFSLIKKNGGKLIFASHPPSGELIRIDPHELISGKQIVGSWGGACSPDIDIPRLYEVIKKSNFDLKKLISSRYKLEEINVALRELESGQVFRPLIEMTHEGEW